MKEKFELKETFNVTAEELFKSWLNSKAHAAMTGGEAHISDVEGEAFTAWDNYISGRNKTLIPNKEIVQHWRTAEFDNGDEDSILTLKLVSQGNTCELTLIHENIPAGQTQYKQGWVDNYFAPMHAYFATLED